MKVFYTASYYGKEKYQKHYNLVLKTLVATGVEVVSPETGNYLAVLSKREMEKLKDTARIHYEAIRKGIQLAQAVIIEMSNEDFQLGHEATLAIQAKKYVLCLSTHEDFSKKIINPYFQGARYNHYNVEEIISNFIELAKKEQLNERFNLFLSPRQLMYVTQMAEKEGINKSEYVRRLIEEDRK